MRDIPSDAAGRKYPTEVFRMDLDVTGDGVPELFLGTTWGTSRQGVPWVVYTRQPDGRFRPLGFLEFGYDAFYYLAAESRLCAPKSAGPRVPGYYACYHMGEDGVWQIMDRAFGTLEENDARTAEWQQKGRPPVYRAALQDLGRPDGYLQTTSPPRWRDTITGETDSSLGRLEGLVAEAGDCSAEKLLKEYRGAGCMALP